MLTPVPNLALAGFWVSTLSVLLVRQHFLSAKSRSERMLLKDIQALARKVLFVPRVINGSAGFKCELAHPPLRIHFLQNLVVRF